MEQEYTLMIESDEEGWLVSEVIELPGCHTQARTAEVLLQRTAEAIRAFTASERNL